MGEKGSSCRWHFFLIIGYSFFLVIYLPFPRPGGLVVGGRLGNSWTPFNREVKQTKNGGTLSASRWNASCSGRMEMVVSGSTTSAQSEASMHLAIKPNTFVDGSRLKGQCQCRFVDENRFGRLTQPFLRRHCRFTKRWEPHTFADWVPQCVSMKIRSLHWGERLSWWNGELSLCRPLPSAVPTDPQVLPGCRGQALPFAVGFWDESLTKVIIGLGWSWVRPSFFDVRPGWRRMSRMLRSSTARSKFLVVSRVMRWRNCCEIFLCWFEVTKHYRSWGFCDPLGFESESLTKETTT